MCLLAIYLSAYIPIYLNPLLILLPGSFVVVNKPRLFLFVVKMFIPYHLHDSQIFSPIL